ncbi:hypothetical protein SDC9_46551 [bioreactor metagenome]|uniref:Uncharacterized protein n=1 Tax=bioreactor metagenome TaxID=1076179 RepID=A0A644W9Z6_9ZZZZ
MGQQSSRESAVDGAYHQGKEPGAEKPHACHFGGHGILPDGDACRPPPGAEEVPRHKHASGEADQHHGKGGEPVDARKPPRAVSYLEIFEDDPEGFAEAEDGYGEVVAPEFRPEGGNTDDQADEPCRRSPRREGEIEGNVVVVGKDRRSVGAHCHESGVPKGEKPREPGEDGEAEHGDHVDARENHNGKNIVHGYTFSSLSCPQRPLGLQTRKAIRSVKLNTSRITLET